jgi:hypothetical protein
MISFLGSYRFVYLSVGLFFCFLAIFGLNVIDTVHPSLALAVSVISLVMAALHFPYRMFKQMDFDDNWDKARWMISNVLFALLFVFMAVRVYADTPAVATVGAVISLINAFFFWWMVFPKLQLKHPFMISHLLIHFVFLEWLR